MFHYSLRVIDEPKMSEIRIFNLCHKKTILVDIYRQSLLINFSCYMLPINILIYTVYPSIISQWLFFCTKSGQSFKGQRLFEEENIPSFPSAPWSDGWTQNIKFSFTSLAISLFSKMGLKDQHLCNRSTLDIFHTFIVIRIVLWSGCDPLLESIHTINNHRYLSKYE